jgi:hypothetical protein
MREVHHRGHREHREFGKSVRLKPSTPVAAVRSKEFGMLEKSGSNPWHGFGIIPS